MTITIDRVDPSDGISQPPDHLVVVDVLVDVTSEDVWTAAGCTAYALNGARFVYAFAPDDPNDPQGPQHVQLLRPGTAAFDSDCS